MPHTTKEERDSARGALGACDCFQCRLMMDFDELARASSGSTGAPPLAQPTPPELSRAVEALKMFADVSEDYENDGVCMTAKDARLLRESISAVLPHLLPHKPTFDDSSYAIPLERRLEAATIEFSHPRLGISPTNKHTTPLTTEEAKRLLALLKSAPLAQPTPPLTAKQITEICHLLHTGANYADDFSDAAEAANEGEEIEWDVDGMKNGRRDAVKLREASERARHSTP